MPVCYIGDDLSESSDSDLDTRRRRTPVYTRIDSWTRRLLGRDPQYRESTVHDERVHRRRRPRGYRRYRSRERTDVRVVQLDDSSSDDSVFALASNSDDWMRGRRRRRVRSYSPFGRGLGSYRSRYFRSRSRSRSYSSRRYRYYSPDSHRRRRFYSRSPRRYYYRSPRRHRAYSPSPVRYYPPSGWRHVPPRGHPWYMPYQRPSGPGWQPYYQPTPPPAAPLPMNPAPALPAPPMPPPNGTRPCQILQNRGDRYADSAESHLRDELIDLGRENIQEMEYEDDYKEIMPDWRKNDFRYKNRLDRELRMDELAEILKNARIAEDKARHKLLRGVGV